VHEGFSFIARLPEFVPLKGSMPRHKAHYSLVLRNHHTGKRLRLELIDLLSRLAKVFASGSMVDGQRNCRWRAKRLWSDSFAPGGWRIERYPSVLIQADPPFALETTGHFAGATA
jgi:hypothetical protein